MDILFNDLFLLCRNDLRNEFRPREQESRCSFLSRSTYSNIRFLRDSPGNDSELYFREIWEGRGYVRKS